MNTEIDEQQILDNNRIRDIARVVIQNEERVENILKEIRSTGYKIEVHYMAFEDKDKYGVYRDIRHWRAQAGGLIGLGGTPNKAIEDLMQRFSMDYIKYGKSKIDPWPLEG